MEWARRFGAAVKAIIERLPNRVVFWSDLLTDQYAASLVSFRGNGVRVEKTRNLGRVLVAHHLKFAIERIDYLVAVTYMTAHNRERLPVIDGRR